MFRKTYGRPLKTVPGQTIPGLGIRTLRLSLEDTEPADKVPCRMSLFRSPEEEERQKKVELAMLNIKRKFGKSALLRGIDYSPKATLRSRNE